MNDEIIEVFNNVLSTYRSIDIAESEFKRLVFDDEDLHRLYREWCEENGVTEKHGFIGYCQERFDEEESYWDSLADYDYDYDT